MPRQNVLKFKLLMTTVIPNSLDSLLRDTNLWVIHQTIGRSASTFFFPSFYLGFNSMKRTLSSMLLVLLIV